MSVLPRGNQSDQTTRQIPQHEVQRDRDGPDDRDKTAAPQQAPQHLQAARRDQPRGLRVRRFGGIGRARRFRRASCFDSWRSLRGAIRQFRRDRLRMVIGQLSQEDLRLARTRGWTLVVDLRATLGPPSLPGGWVVAMVLAGDGRGHIYHINSLEFPLGHMADLPSARKEIPLGSMDIVATNPPFGSDIPITDKAILEQYELAHQWEPDGEGGFCNTGATKGSVAPEILFIERCIKWLKPGTGRMGIVLPDGVLGNPAAEYIRWWIMRETQVLASVDLPVEAFIAEANVNILTGLLFLRRKSESEKRAEALGGAEEYPVFMAVADKVGFDRRGNKLYKRTPDGEEIIKPRQHTERIRIGGRFVERTLTRSEKIEDNDLPVIAEKYREFLKEHDG